MSTTEKIREVDSRGNCSKCGGTHYGSYMCPIEEVTDMTKPDADAPSPPQYYGNFLNQFENGVQLDLRTKLAIEFLKSQTIPAERGPGGAVIMASAAFDLAEQVMLQAERRGYLKPLPTDDELTVPLRRHIRQNVRAQVYQQIVGQRIMEEEAPTVQPARGGLPGRQ